MKLAMVFPGQGSQSLGMMSAYEGHAVISDTFAEASTLLGEDLWQLAAEGPEAALMQTVNTQPLMLTADVAVFRAWSAAGGPLPSVVAGHSLGEYAALVAAGALAFADAVPLVRFRAEAMQEAARRAVPRSRGKPRAPCAGGKPSATSAGVASPMSSNAALARCWRDSGGASTANWSHGRSTAVLRAPRRSTRWRSHERRQSP